ncbi:MAG TPA: hypothetical protein VGC77_09950 [Rhodopseudomonas sp.]|uniref:hypothetical protein n=1 Tax=Rhodopseudomonas sp. TaxID=1078 RepID=UPI002EDAB0A4
MAIAQAPPAAAPAQVAPAASQPSGSGNCAPSRTAPEQGSITTPDATTGQGREPLGDKLARSDGVLCPPAGVDPEIRAPTPQVGNTPVIPPPGSPGGDPSVRPK